MNLYFISGLGADKRIFQKLQLPDIFQIHYIEWMPVSKNESLKEYCDLLSEQIDQTSPYTIVGMSFGGLVAVEMAKKLKPVQTVMISSFCCKPEVSKFYVFMGKTRLYKLFPIKFLLKPNKLVFRLFGAKAAELKKLLESILLNTDPDFFIWAVEQLFSWDNNWKPPDFIRLHGTKDKILPYQNNMNAIPVEEGGHLMVYSKAEIVSEILSRRLLSA